MNSLSFLRLKKGEHRKMSKLRMGRMNKLLREELSWIIQHKINSPEIHSPEIGIITITNIVTSPDLRQAKVYVSFIGNEDDKKALKALKASVKPIKKILAQRTNLRFTPDLFFHIDDTVEELLKIEELFNKIKSESDEESIDE